MPRPLRILTPLHSFEPGGVERVALRLNAHWQQRGIDAIVLMGRDAGAMGTGNPPAQYRTFDQPGFSTAPFETLWMTARLPGAIRRLQPDILFCAGNTYAVVMLAMRMLLGRRCPPIVIKVSNDLARRDMHPAGRWFYRRWLRLQGRLAHAVVGMAEPMRAEIAVAMGVDPAKVWIVEDAAVSIAELALLAQPRTPAIRERRFVAAGRLTTQKNFALMLRAFAQGAASEDRLTIIGDGPDRAALERLVATLGLTGRVTMPGYQSSVAESFAEADYFLMSSDYEGVPAVVIEALAAGLPIVATNCSVSMDYLLQSGRFGLLTKVGDTAAFAHALTAIKSRPYSANAARTHAARFTVEHAAKAYLQVFSNVVAAPGRSSHIVSDIECAALSAP
ncbi:Glycosyltransferase [Sphingomonas antarctica]|uniref:glycosyltransferase n=1 Tax=Sphingomonas antarctica TaxID=2040274 RepID=UPI0039EB5AAA